MSIATHVEALKVKHSQLDHQVVAEDHRPLPDADELHRLKVEKLHIKDELERLKSLN